MKTTTQTLYEQLRRDEHETRLHWMHRTFAEKYAPADPRDRDVFGADLALLLRELQMDALKPFQEAAAQHFAMRPMPPVYINQKEGQTDGKV